MYQALYRKWRPRSFDDVVGQEHITETLKRQVEAGRLTHAYLFTGTRGTGKTTCAKILARAVNCQTPNHGNPCNQCPACRGIEHGSILDVVELDAASNNRVDDVRAMLDEAIYTPAAVGKRVYIIDEVHMLSTQAFNALLQILEEPPSHLMFIMATTELHKVPATIKSRCQQFAFKRIHAGQIADRLSYVADQEGISLTQEAASLIARLADGGMRDALSLLDQCTGGGSAVDQDRVYQVLGLAGNLQTAALLGDIASGDLTATLERLAQLYAGGKEMLALAGELAALIRDLLVAKSAPNSGTGLLTGGYDSQTMAQLGKSFDVPRLVQMLRCVQRTLGEMVHTANRRTDMELCLVMLSDPTLADNENALSARVAKLEQQIATGRTTGNATPQQTASAATPRQDSPRLEQKARMDATPALQDAVMQERGELLALHNMEREDALQESLRDPRGDIPVKMDDEEGREALTVKQTAEKVTACAQGPSRSSSEHNWPGWAAVCGQLKGILSTADYTFFSMPNMLSGRWDGEGVTLWAANSFVADLLGKGETTGAVARVVSGLMGQQVRVKVRVGAPPAERTPAAPVPKDEGHADALDAFLAAGHSNVIEET